MLGHKVFQTTGANFRDTWCTVRGGVADSNISALEAFRSTQVVQNVDVTDLREVNAMLERLRPDVLVNCAGLVKQRPEAADPILSITINGLLPHWLADTLARWGGRLIHISTDCVFDGVRGAYTEDDLPNAIDLYGRTKALGEVASSNALTIRSSIIGRELQAHGALLEWFLAQNRGKVRGFQNAWWSGVTTNHMADLIVSLIRNHSDLSGLYQVSSGRISKYELLVLLREAYNLDIEIVADSSYVIDRTLVGKKLEDKIGYRCPPWQQLLSQLVRDPTPYPSNPNF